MIAWTVRSRMLSRRARVLARGVTSDAERSDGWTGVGLERLDALVY
jgi:hypothetical protein